MNFASFPLESVPARAERRGRRPLRRPRVLTTVLGALVATGLVTAAACTLASRLLLNVTRSMPLGVYWMRRGSPRAFARRDLVAFPVPPSVKGLVLDRHYLMDGALLLKPVAAVAGDVVCIEGDALTIGGELTGRLRSRDSEGRGLPRDARCEALAAGLVYVLAPDPRSFDSRVFGPVDVHTLSEVTPLWTF
jgi:conjugative transfer signal peptidase TraF